MLVLGILTGNISSILPSGHSLLGAGHAVVPFTDAVAGREDVSPVDQGATTQHLLLPEPDPRRPGLVLLHRVAVHDPVSARHTSLVPPPPVVLLPLAGVVLLNLRTAAACRR